MNNYEKLISSTKEELTEKIIDKCGKACPCYEYCNVTSTPECRAKVMGWMETEQTDAREKEEQLEDE